MPDLASVTKPIQELTRKGVKFVWGEEQQTAFERLKQMITHADTLAYYKVGRRRGIIADTSPVGVGAHSHNLKKTCGESSRMPQEAYSMLKGGTARQRKKLWR